MKHLIQKSLFLLLLCLAFAAQAQKFSLSGYIKDANDGEELIGATVLVKELATGTTSNVYGFYSLTLPKGKYTITYSFVGYQSIVKTIELDANQQANIELPAEERQIEGVEIVAEDESQDIRSVQMSVNKLEMRTIQRIPTLLGEVDVIRSIQTLPGVSTVGEGATGFNVRGGGIDQNLVLLDEAPVYNSAHLFGFFSVFNPDAVKDVKLIKGGIPAQYGGRISSLLDVRMKEGNKKRFEMNGGIGAIFSRLTLEAPIVKDKGSFIIAARRSYIDILAKPFLTSDLKDSKFYFYDVTAKANYELGKKDKLFLSGYFGRDVFGSGFEFNWGNATASLRWSHIFNDRLFLNSTAFFSSYDYKIGFGQDSRDNFNWGAEIKNYSIKPEFTYYLNTNNTLTFGGQSILYEFIPGKAVGTSGGSISDVSLENKTSLETGIYIGNEQKVSPKISMQYGLRWSFFNYLGAITAYEYGTAPAGTRREAISEKKYGNWENVTTYNNLEPRFALTYEINPKTSIKASYNRTTQYIHLISNSAASLPVDVWTPSTNNIKPQIADQVALGFFKNLGEQKDYEFSVEAYYKDLQNQVDYIDGANLFLNKYLEGDLLTGKGRAYGLELYLKKNSGKLNGWISATISRSERQVEGINLNNWYPNRFDKLLSLNAILMYDLNEKWNFSANFTLGTGTPTTFPTNRIEFDGYVIPQNSLETRNNYRIPIYHRLDLSATYTPKRKEGRRWHGHWVFSIYNAYNRRNPFSIYFRQNQNNPNMTEAVRLAVFGSIIPSVTYNFKF
ncbi:MAG: TonB-dependent receptor [Bacteroidetes bacterium]|nr:MAG: TonB-dependent receptor [Bacteroidota bacterium]